MDCPKCNTEMAPGKVKMESTLLGSFIFGLSRQHLWFGQGTSEADGEIVMKSGSSRDACRCPKCGTLVIPYEQDLRG